MALCVVTVASGGLPVVDVTATKPLLGMAVAESTSTPNKIGIAVTKVTNGLGMPVSYVVPPL
jgi:hypothetical protein